MFDPVLLNNLYSSRVAVFHICPDGKITTSSSSPLHFLPSFIFCMSKRLKTDENRGHSRAHSAVAYICSQKSAKDCVTALS